MTADISLPTNNAPLPSNSGYTAPKSLSLFDTAGGAALNSATEFFWRLNHELSSCVAAFTDNHWIFLTSASNTTSLYRFFFLIQPVQKNFRKHIKNKSISNCPGPTSIQLLPDIQFVVTGRYFNRLDDPNTPTFFFFKKVIALFFFLQ